ncbi:hypothetical protein ACSQ67_024245 [Phaseolus vulgaris]
MCSRVCLLKVLIIMLHFYSSMIVLARLRILRLFLCSCEPCFCGTTSRLGGCSYRRTYCRLANSRCSKKISGVHKRCWKYLPNVVKASESSTNSTSPTDIDLKVETEAS